MVVDPRWVSVTEYPSRVWIVTTLPLPGTVPANETVPEAGADTVVPVEAPMSMPRCWPAAYGSSPSTNFWSTGPFTGQDQLAAVGANTSARAVAKIRAGRMEFSLLSLLPTMVTVAVPPDVVNMDYKDMS
jgi:hypothetical protein